MVNSTPEQRTLPLAIAPSLPPGTEPLSKEELLSALDAQIRFATEAQRNEGLTRWAIWGGLAAILWRGTVVFAQSEFALYRAVLVAFVIFIIWAILESFISLISPTSRVSIAPVRFQVWTDMVSVVRPGVIASALRQTLIIVALGFFHYANLWPLWMYAILSLLGDLLAFAPGTSNLPLPTKLGVRTSFAIATLIPVAWLAYCGLHVVALIRKDFPSFTLADVQFAWLLNGGAYLLIRLATMTTSGHFLTELTELRQHLAFNRISTAEAIQQADKLLSGIKLTDVLNPSVLGVIREAQELMEMVKRSAAALEQLKSTASSFSGNIHDLDGAAIAGAARSIDELDSEAKRLHLKLKALIRAQGRFQLRAMLIAMYSRESLPDLKEPAKKVQDAFNEASKSLTDLHKLRVAVKSELTEILHQHQRIAIEV